ncbi:MAG TPA: hypothetical protein VK324_00270, partial [Tepidisphaeraceae bacterium]|nr:hypothetical protein [Tepidisphaeraceae bacterium]
MWQQERPNNRAWPKVTVDADDKPFWDVLLELCDKAHLRPYPHGGSEKREVVKLMSAHGNGVGRTHSTPVATLVLTQISRTLTVNFQSGDPAAPARRERASVSLHVYLDPRLRATQYAYQPVIEAAADQDGRSLLPADGQDHRSQEHFQQMHYGPWYFDTSTSLKYDPAESTDLSVLQGYVRVRAATGTDRIEIDDVPNAKGQEKTAAGRKLVVEDVTTDKGRTKLEFSIRRTPEVSNKEWQALGSNLFQGFTLLDAAGNRVNYTGGSSTHEPDRYEVTYEGLSAVPQKLTWEFATRTAQYNIRFEFQDLPLP